MKASVLWSNFLGIFVHDHETGLYHFGINHIDRVYKEGKLVVENKHVSY